MALAEEEETLAQQSEEEPEEGTDFLELDEGDNLSCVLHRLLLAPKTESHPQRHSLFKTRCTVKGKFCNVIIDSSENMVPKKLVCALNLKVEPHPTLIRLAG